MKLKEFKEMNVTEEVNRTVCDALDNGDTIIVEHDTYRQHILREHPNVCRQTFRYTTEYRIHHDPCDCPPLPNGQPEAHKTDEGICCWIIQPIDTACMYCGEGITK
jgi:hypothetical protein